jgi:hypothetical protein
MVKNYSDKIALFLLLLSAFSFCIFYYDCKNQIFESGIIGIAFLGLSIVSFGIFLGAMIDNALQLFIDYMVERFEKKD